jgi:hypothetical protein
MKETRHKNPHVVGFHLYELHTVGKSGGIEGRLVTGRSSEGRNESYCAMGTSLLQGGGFGAR